MLTESLFADECEPFFNSIGPKRTCALPGKPERNSIFLPAPICPEGGQSNCWTKWAEKSPSVGGRGYECPAADDVSIGRPLC